MLIQTFNDCQDCNTISLMLSKIDCKLAEIGNDLYNNISYLVNNKIDYCLASKLLFYKQILTSKSHNPDYLKCWCICDIVDKVTRLTINCKSKCFKPENCDPPNFIALQKIFTNEFNNVFS